MYCSPTVLFTNILLLWADKLNETHKLLFVIGLNQQKLIH